MHALLLHELLSFCLLFLDSLFLETSLPDGHKTHTNIEIPLSTQTFDNNAHSIAKLIASMPSNFNQKKKTKKQTNQQ